MYLFTLIIKKGEINVTRFNKYCVSDGPITGCLAGHKLHSFKAAMAMPVAGSVIHLLCGSRLRSHYTTCTSHVD
jgi:hypothetical protein